MKHLNPKFVESILKDSIRKTLTTGQAAAKLGCTKQYINKLKRRYLTEGKSCFVHGNIGSSRLWKTSKEMEETILTLYTSVYEGFNFRHFLEKLNEVEHIHITYKPLYRILSMSGMVSPKGQRRKKKEKLHPTRPRRQQFGELAQMDASLHPWFGTDFTKATLHGAIDDATGIVLGLFFDREETLFGYFNIVRQILDKYGIPEAFYSDNRSIFEFRKISEKNQDIDRDIHIQFKRCCEQLGIQLITTSVAQAKGRVERLWGTLQSRLMAELRLANIHSIASANAFLPRFILDYNRRFALVPDLETSLFAPAPSPKEINYYLSIHYHRKTDNGSSFKFKGQKLQLASPDGLTVPIPPKTIIDVYVTFSNTIVVFYDNNLFDVKPVDTLLSDSSTKKPGRPKWKPDANHPWRKRMLFSKKT